MIFLTIFDRNEFLYAFGDKNSKVILLGVLQPQAPSLICHTVVTTGLTCRSLVGQPETRGFEIGGGVCKKGRIHSKVLCDNPPGMPRTAQKMHQGCEGHRATGGGASRTHQAHGAVEIDAVEVLVVDHLAEPHADAEGQ